LVLFCGESLADLPISLCLFSDTAILSCSMAELLTVIATAGVVVLLTCFFLWFPLKACLRLVYRFKKK
jgi:hypothetical protein